MKKVAFVNKYLRFDMERIRELLRQRDTVLFVGSGISLWSGLPSWAALIEELAVFIQRAGGDPGLIRSEAERGEYLQAASYGFDTLSKSQIGEFIRLACRYGVARPHEIHKLIVSLGPTCFITSNYDNLLEESIRIWRSDEFFRPPVTNRNLTALAEIVHASSVNFIFKPHGDASDTDSIVLTREQYRDLLPGGERHAALESAKMLLASRPIIYLGFGLRDPDFIYIRDLLSNTYKRASRDHYAIMADVSPPEIQWWRKNYGVHLTGYSTTLAADGHRDHSSLLALLKDLSTEKSAATPTLSGNDAAALLPQLMLSLARHAARLTRHQRIDPELPVRVSLNDRSSRKKILATRRHHDFDHWHVNEFLIEGPDKTILIGLPGAGKTYAVARAAAQLAEELHDLCLDENPPESEIVVPVLIDMKMYRGNLLSLIEGSLPTGILEALLQRKWKIKVFLDSFNEMPREHSETVGYEADLTRVFRDIEMSIVIASRTSDGLSNFGFPAYCLDHIDADYLKAELSRRSVSIGGRFENEILRLLQKPFYFHLFIKNEMTLSGEPHPREIFQSFFSSLLTKYHERFSSRIRLMNCLQQAAYSSIEQGQEAWPIQYLLHVMRDDASESGETTDFTGIANWLVSQEILIPYTGARVAFFHQSVTEYLAASEAARLFRLDARSLAAKLAFTRWDQALYLTLSLLPLESSNEFLDEIIRADYIFALNATKYLEFDRDMVVSRLLEEMLKQSGGDFDTSHKIANALRELPVTTVHVEPLRRVMSTGNMLGAAAAGRLVELLGDEIKDELIRTLYERREDFNYCVNGVAPALLSRMSADDLPKVQAVVDMAMIEVNPLSSEETCHGLTHGVAALLREMDLEKITVAFLPESEAPIMEIRARILCDLARDRRSTEGLQLAAELLLRGVKRAATAIFFILEFRGAETIDFSVLDKRHVDRLIVAVQDRSSKDWPQRALTGICLVRADLREIVMAHAESATGLLRVALLVASGAPTRWDALWQELAQITQPDIGGPPAADWNLLHEIDIDWTGHEKLFVDLLKRRDSALAPTLIDNIEDVGELDFGSIDWILEWLDEERTKNHHFMLYDRMSRLIEEKARPAIREAFLSEFNSNKSKYLSVLASSILLARSDLTTDMLSENAISFLLARLGNADDSNFRESLLTRCATETFVEDKLLGLLSNTTEPFYSNLLRVLDSAGRRHGRRYIRS